MHNVSAQRMPILGATVRSMPSGSIAAVAVSTTVVFVSIAAARGQTAADLSLRIALVVSASCAGLAFDDGARRATEPSPTSLGRRRLVRALVAALILTAGWAIDLVVATRWWGLDNSTVMHRGIVLAAVASLSFAASSIIERVLDEAEPGAMATMITLLVVATDELLAMRWPSVLPSTLADTPNQGACWVVLGLSLLAVGWFSRDPAARLRSPRSPKTGGPRVGNNREVEPTG